MFKDPGSKYRVRGQIVREIKLHTRSRIYPLEPEYDAQREPDGSHTPVLKFGVEHRFDFALKDGYTIE